MNIFNDFCKILCRHPNRLQFLGMGATIRYMFIEIVPLFSH